jgi:hypothetical protein
MLLGYYEELDQLEIDYNATKAILDNPKSTAEEID